MTKTKKLGEVFDIRKGKKATTTSDTFVPGSHPYIQIDEVRGVAPTRFAIDPKPVMVTGDDLCIVWDGANAGTVGYGVAGAIGSTVSRLRLKEPDRWDPRFLGRLLDGLFPKLNQEAQSRGATIPHVDKAKLEEIDFPLIAPREQRRIAAILDKADAIRRKREQALTLAGDFLRSVFLEMFGDPVTNPKGFRECPLGEIADIASGLTKGRKTKEDEKLYSVPYMRVANVQDGFLDLSEIKLIDATSAEIDRYALKAGDLLLTEGGDPDKLGRGSVWSNEIENCIHQNHIFRVRLRTVDIHPIILQHQVGSLRGKSYFLRAAKQTTGIASINKQQLSAYPTLIPDPELQDRYLEIIKSFGATQMKLNKAAKETGDLFAALSQRAFAGDL